MRRYTQRRSGIFRRSQNESQLDGKIIVWSHRFPCPRRLKANKGEKYIHTRPLNRQNIKKIKITFTCTNPRNDSAKKDVVETFMLQLLITLFPQSTGSYLYY